VHVSVSGHYKRDVRFPADKVCLNRSFVWRVRFAGAILATVCPTTDSGGRRTVPQQRLFEDAGLSQLYPIFLDEARDNLDRIAHALLSVGIPDAKPELVDSIYRCVHSIKGGSASFGLNHLAELMHVCESVLQRWRQDRVVPDIVSIGLLLDATAVARRQLAGDTLANASATELAQRLRKLVKPVERAMPVRLVHVVVEPPHRREQLDAVAGVFREIAGLGELVDMSGEDDGNMVFVIRSDAQEGELLDLLAMYVDREQVRICDRIDQMESTPIGGAHRVDLPPGLATVRVPVHELDQIASMSQHVVDSIDRLRRMSQLLVPPISADTLCKLVDDAADLQQLAVGLQKAFTNLRTAPLLELFDLAGGLIRHLAITLGKEFVQDFSGQAIRVERRVLQALVDPFVHIVRNCCDHGIESPSERQAAGKPRAGRIRLDSQALEGAIRIVVQDDGRGLSRSGLLGAARAAGIDVSDNLGDEDVWQLIFLPGISTAPAVTQVSGRGVGMDVLRSTVAALGGSVGITSSPGAGTTVTIDLPSNISV